eukprot:1451713-Amphidinium_carterae.1
MCTNADKIPSASPTTKIGPAQGKCTQALSANNSVNASQWAWNLEQPNSAFNNPASVSVQAVAK